MNILLVNPKYPDTKKGLTHVFKFNSKKTIFPSTGLFAQIPLLPGFWNTKLVDLNYENLKEGDLTWAHYVFISATAEQSKSAKEIIGKCKTFRKKLVAGGSLFKNNYDRFPEIDHFILDDAETTLPMFIDDLFNGQAKKLYKSNKNKVIIEKRAPALID